MHDDPRRPDEAEREADAFASEFLMPAAEIRPQLNRLDLARAALLKRYWKVAMSAIIRRARDLGRIDDRRYQSLNVQISQRWWRKIEPVELGTSSRLSFLRSCIYIMTSTVTTSTTWPC
jgi:Zn-dependent peptidase ImmA (M78 family)